MTRSLGVIAHVPSPQGASDLSSAREHGGEERLQLTAWHPRTARPPPGTTTLRLMRLPSICCFSRTDMRECAHV